MKKKSLRTYRKIKIRNYVKMGIVTTFKSQNLRGENRKEERRRIRHERIKAIREGKSRKEVSKIGGWRAGLYGFRNPYKNPLD